MTLLCHDMTLSAVEAGAKAEPDSKNLPSGEGGDEFEMIFD